MELLKTIIPIGKHNAIHQDELAKRLGSTKSYAKNLVRQARLQGLEVCSGAQGYWLAENDSERKAFVNLMYKQGLARLKSANTIRQTLENIQGQICFSDIVTNTSEGGDIN